MTEIETLLIESLQQLSVEFETREKHLIGLLNDVSERLELMTSNYQALSQQITVLSTRLDDLSE